jgi:cell division protein FtsW
MNSDFKKYYDRQGGSYSRGAVERELEDYRREEKKRSGKRQFDLPLMVLTLVLLVIGVVMVLSASFARAYYTSGSPTYIFSRQLFFAATGVIIMLVVSRFKVSTFMKLSLPLLGVSIVLLIAVLIVGVEENGAKRWLDFGISTVQPSEIAKIALIMTYAVMICTYKDKMKTFKYGVLPFAIIALLIVGLLYLEPHLSASVIILAITVIMMFAGGTQPRWFIALGAVAAIAAFLTVTQFSYASSRITAWLDPDSDPLGSGYQILQSLYAVGSGGLMGVGLGQSRQKYLYLPEEHNDYIFAVICEELGYIGAVLILLLFTILIIRGFWLAMHARDRYGSLVITGIISLLAIQVFLNVAVVSNLIPSTGISLPFFSYGGTALWIQMAEMGIVLAISRDIPIKKSG